MQYINIACEIGESVHCFFGWIGIASGHGLAWLVDEHIYESCGDSITHQAASNIIARLLPYLSFILLNKAWHNLTHTHIYTQTHKHTHTHLDCAEWWVFGYSLFGHKNHCTSVRVCPPPNPWNPWKLEPASKSSPMRCSNLANFPGYVKTFKHLPCHFELGNGN
jgi:hypothetical protein